MAKISHYLLYGPNNPSQQNPNTSQQRQNRAWAASTETLVAEGDENIPLYLALIRPHLGGTVSSAGPHKSQRRQTDWMWSKGGPRWWSKGWTNWPMRKGWGSQVFSPWRKGGLGGTHNRISALKGQLQRGQDLSSQEATLRRQGTTESTSWQQGNCNLTI